MQVFYDLFTLTCLVLIGLWLADFATGLFHWAVDNYCDPAWPLIGQGYILPSHKHHADSQYDVDLSSFTLHIHIWITVLIVGVMLWVLGLMNLIVASACFFGFFTNVIHSWSHTKKENQPRIVRLLQRVGLFQSTHHHLHHHCGQSDSHFCLLTDHINPVLEALDVWPLLDKVFLRLGIRKYWWNSQVRPEDLVNGPHLRPLVATALRDQTL